MRLAELINDLQWLYETYGDLECLAEVCDDAAIPYRSFVEKVVAVEYGGRKYINVLGGDI